MSKPPRIQYRDLHGIVLLDKPIGLSSNQALQGVRRLLRAAKGGHAGALDPLASGLLPLCFGEATKLAGTLLGASKGYLAECRLGISTDTGDREGEVTARQPVPRLDPGLIEAALAPLRGAIRQVLLALPATSSMIRRPSSDRRSSVTVAPVTAVIDREAARCARCRRPASMSGVQRSS